MGTLEKKAALTPLERLFAARIIGTAVLAILGQLTVDFPNGYLGKSDELTGFGAIYAVSYCGLSLILFISLFFHRRWTVPFSYLLFSVNFGLFAPAIVSDPVTAGLIVLWHLSIIVWSLLSPPRTLSEPRREEDSSQRFMHTTGRAGFHLSLLSIFTTTGIVGYQLTSRPIAHLTCLFLNVVAAIPTARLIFLEIRGGRRLTGLLYLPLVLGVVTAGTPVSSLVLFLFYQLAVSVLMLSKGAVINELVRFLLKRTALLTILTFLFLAALGTLLLTFPIASASSTRISPLDALFTAVSASCVTGLAVLDTPHDLSLFGQIVVLGLIQVGELGIIVLSTFATLILGGRLGFRRGQSMAALLEITGPKSANRLTMIIVSATLAIETVGSLLLLPSFLLRGHPLGESAWLAVFHAVSAFCNAGFALQSDSVVLFQRDPYSLGVIMALIVLGGLGFLVIAAYWWKFRGQEIRMFRTQIRVVLWGSMGLTVLGFLAVTGVEWRGALSSLPPLHRIANGLFQSVTLRTAGFNSVDLSTFAPATVLVMLFLMFIGASPGGTGGGIKTTTLLVLLAGLFSISRGESHVTLFRRTIPQATLLRAGAVVISASGVVFIGLFLLLLTQDQPFQTLAFEVVSAVATVGLSIGKTAGLTPLGKFVIAVLMFIGRVGPLTVAIVMGSTRESRVTHAETQLMVG